MKATAILALVTCLCVATFQASGDDKVLVEKKAILDSESSIDAALAKKCDVENLVGNRILEQMKHRIPDAASLEESTAERFVRTRIMSIRVIESVDIKLMNVEAEIVQGDVVLRANRFRSRTMLQSTPDMDVCALIERVANQVGGRMAFWVPAALKALTKKSAAPAAENDKSAADPQR